MLLQVCVCGVWQDCAVVLLTHVCAVDLQVCAVPPQVCGPPVHTPGTKPLQVCVCAPLHVCVCGTPVCGQFAAVASHQITLSFS
jgi:hypothetical protein